VRALRTIAVTRYVTPLREGGSLPALVEADDEGMYVLKFRAAGHGVLALVAELLAGEIGRALTLPVPEIVLASLDGDLARTEPDPEIHALIHDSAGLNLALDYLPGSVMFDPTVTRPDPEIASQIVWLDAFVSNVDRTPRNPNLLMWHKRIWLIDHGASLYFHHSPTWSADTGRPRDPFVMIKDHVLLRFASALRQADDLLAPQLTATLIDDIVGMIPDGWLADPGPAVSAPGTSASTNTSGAANGNGAAAEAAARRLAYGRYLRARVEAPRLFVEEALRVR
jgi:hypothetical protein